MRQIVQRGNGSQKNCCNVITCAIWINPGVESHNHVRADYANPPRLYFSGIVTDCMHAPINRQMKSDLRTLAKVCKVKKKKGKKNPDVSAQTRHGEKHVKRHYIPIQCGVQLAIFLKPDGKCVFQAFYQARLWVRFELTPETLLNDLCTYWNQPAGYWCLSLIN